MYRPLNRTSFIWIIQSLKSENALKSKSYLTDCDVGRQKLLPAALEELENRLQKQASALMKMIGCGRVTRQNDCGETSQLLSNERRTRQRSKKENKVHTFVKIFCFLD